MNTVVQDVRYAFRMLLGSPGFAAIAVLTLAIGIGAHTALFSVVNGVLLNPLPYPHSEELLAVYQTSPGFDRAPAAYLNFLDWERSTRSLASIAMYRNEDYNFLAPAGGERVTGYMVSSEFFSTLKVNPILGRDFRRDDDRLGAAPVVMLGGGFWARAFGSDPHIVGKSILLSGASYTVVGVAPAAFTFYGQQRDVYTPLGQFKEPMFRDRRIVFSSSMIGRMKPGITLPQARADMSAIVHNLAIAYPEANKGLGIALFPMKEDMVGTIEPILLVLWAAVAFLLLIACANVANLLLARSMGRSGEFAIRAALGASALRVVRQLLTESLLLAGLGGGLGIALAVWATKASVSILPATLPRSGEVLVDRHVIFFSLGVSLLTAFLFGLVPAWKGSRVNLQDVLKESGRGSSGARHRLQGMFVAFEVAMALILLVGAGLMARSVAALWLVDPGFNPNHAITFSLAMPATGDGSTAATRARLREFDRKMREIPSVRAVSVTLGSRPMIHNSTESFWIEGHPKPANFNEMNPALFYLAESGFAEAMGLTMHRGRFITQADNENSAIVVVIDDVFERMYFPREDPIGKRIDLAGFGVQAQIVGIAGHLKQWGLDSDDKAQIQAQFYYPFMQLPEKLMPRSAVVVAVVLRTEGDPTAVLASVRQSVRQMNPSDVIFNVETMRDVLSNSFAARRLSMTLLGAFAALALTLACVGIYGVVSYLAGQRVHEIGVRMAIGAQPSDILRLVVGRGTAMALAGVVAGTGGALVLTRLLTHQLFGVSAQDPLTFTAAALLLFLFAVAASYIPARRAMRVDPIVALRHE